MTLYNVLEQCSAFDSLGNNWVKSAGEQISLACGTLSNVSPGVAAEVSRVFKPYKKQVPVAASNFFNPREPAPSRSGRGIRIPSRKGRMRASSTSTHVKRLVVLRRFDEGEDHTKTQNTMLVDGQFTFLNTDSEESLKKKIVDVMKSANESLANVPLSDIR